MNPWLLLLVVTWNFWCGYALGYRKGKKDYEHIYTSPLKHQDTCEFKGKWNCGPECAVRAWFLSHGIAWGKE